MKWTEEAKKAVSRVPFFIRKQVQKRVEEEATRSGSDKVTLEHVDACPVISEAECLFCRACIRECPTGSLEEAEQGYRVLLGGKLGRHPRLAKEIEGLRGEEAVHAIVEQCLDIYQAHCREGERFALILDRVGDEIFFKKMQENAKR